MTSLTALLPVLLAAISLPGLHAQTPRYYPNEDRHPSCANDLSMGASISTARGVSSAPCTGHVLFDTLPICNEAAGRPTKEMAQRICYTLGTNMYRPQTFSASNTVGQKMVFDCDIYTEYGVREFLTANEGDDVAAWQVATAVVQKHCLFPAASNDFCFHECYDEDGTNIVENGKMESHCEAGGGGPYWATVGIDIDECLNGVLDDCTGPFPSSCTKKKACGEHTKCTNAKGGWWCECEDGYRAEDEEDGPYEEEGCIDRDECEEHSEEDDGEGICGYHAQCINKPGGYICVCLHPELYDEDENKCKKSTCPALPLLPHATPTVPPPQYPEYGNKVTYTCQHGYRVSEHSLPLTLYPHYGFVSQTSFEIKCSASGHWEPYPIPECLPIKCHDPGYILHSERTGNVWEFGHTTTYTCEKGFHPYDRSYGESYFEITCKDDGYWTKGTTCEDIDECKDHPGICGYAAKYCINTIGSYMCSCVPWYHKDPANQKCEHYEGVGSLDRCELMHSMGFCEHGDCYMEDGKASCHCKPGYEGATCDIHRDNPAFVIAVVALVMVAIILCLCFFCYCCKHQVGGHLHGAPVHHGYPQVVKPVSVESAYGIHPTRGVAMRSGLFRGRY